MAGVGNDCGKCGVFTYDLTPPGSLCDKCKEKLNYHSYTVNSEKPFKNSKILTESDIDYLNFLYKNRFFDINYEKLISLIKRYNDKEIANINDIYDIKTDYDYPKCIDCNDYGFVGDPHHGHTIKCPKDCLASKKWLNQK